MTDVKPTADQVPLIDMKPTAEEMKNLHEMYEKAEKASREWMSDPVKVADRLRTIANILAQYSRSFDVEITMLPDGKMVADALDALLVIAPTESAAALRAVLTSSLEFYHRARGRSAPAGGVRAFTITHTQEGADAAWVAAGTFRTVAEKVSTFAMASTSTAVGATRTPIEAAIDRVLRGPIKLPAKDPDRNPIKEDLVPYVLSQLRAMRGRVPAQATIMKALKGWSLKKSRLERQGMNQLWVIEPEWKGSRKNRKGN